MQGDYNNMNILRCNQKFMFRKDRGMDFSVWLFRLGFSLYRPLDGKRSLPIASTAIENQTFGAGVTKIHLVLINYLKNTSLNRKFCFMVDLLFE